MAQRHKALARRPDVEPHAQNMPQSTISFPLTPALSLGEKENLIPSHEESEPFGFTPARATALPLLGERAGVRGNGSSSTLRSHTQVPIEQRPYWVLTGCSLDARWMLTGC